MTLAVVGSVALVISLLFLVPAWIVIRDVRSGRRDPGVE
jgi:hypothetical protein